MMEIYNRIPKEYSHLLGVLYESKGHLVICRMITRSINSNLFTQCVEHGVALLSRMWLVNSPSSLSCVKHRYLAVELHPDNVNT